MAKLHPWLTQTSLWPLILRHGHCISDTRFGDVTIGLQEGEQNGGLWSGKDIVETVRAHDLASKANRPESTRNEKNTHVFEVHLPKKKGEKFSAVDIPNLQSTSAITYDRATNIVQSHKYFISLHD